MAEIYRHSVSSTGYGIKRKGRIQLQRRRIAENGHIYATTALTQDYQFTRAMRALELLEQSTVYVGPVWRRKRDVKPFLMDGETVVRVRLVEVQ